MHHCNCNLIVQLNWLEFEMDKNSARSVTYVNNCRSETSFIALHLQLGIMLYSLLKEAASYGPSGKWGCGTQYKATMACSFRFTYHLQTRSGTGSTRKRWIQGYQKIQKPFIARIYEHFSSFIL